jgi:hypothetical protein
MARDHTTRVDMIDRRGRPDHPQAAVARLGRGMDAGVGQPPAGGLALRQHREVAPVRTQALQAGAGRGKPDCAFVILEQMQQQRRIAAAPRTDADMALPALAVDLVERARSRDPDRAAAIAHQRLHRDRPEPRILQLGARIARHAQHALAAADQ